jgi:Asp-tRNA(Asn)/Glu-tRNA(Gln) amidotransferase A subunit family amidase
VSSGSEPATKALPDLDLIVHPAEEDSTLTIENLTGYPAIAVPWAGDRTAPPDGIAFAAHLDRETDLLGFAIVWQARTDHHRGRPPV